MSWNIPVFDSTGLLKDASTGDLSLTVSGSPSIDVFTAIGVANFILPLTVSGTPSVDVVTSTGILNRPTEAAAPILDTVSLGSASNLPSSPGTNNSDIAYDIGNDEYQVTIQSGGNCDRYSVSGTTWTHEGDVSASTSSSDTEGICWITGNRYAQCSESGGDDHIFIMNNSGTPLTATNEQEHTPGVESGGSNDGLEGIAWASEEALAQGGQAPGLYGNGAFFGVVENRQVFRMECPLFDGNDYHWNYPTSGDALAVVTEFTGPGGTNLSTYLLGVNCDDLAGVEFDPRNGDGRLICVCERSGRILFEFIIGGTNMDELTYAAELDLTNVQWEGITLNADGDYVIVEEGGNAAIITYTGNAVIEEAPVIATLTHTTLGIASTLNATASLSAGGQATWYLKKGPPSATINPSTGAIVWTPSDDLPRGQAVSFRVGCYNSYGHATPVTMIVHVNNTGETGVIHVTGEASIDQDMGPAAEQISGGDTLIVTGSARNIDVTANQDYLNGFIGDGTSGDQYLVPAGTTTQLTTICAEDPYLMISGTPHDAVTQYPNYALFMGTSQGQYSKFMDFSFEQPQRNVAKIDIDNIFLEGMGFYDAGYANYPPPTTNAEAAAAYASLAVAKWGGSDCLADMCHVAGQGRYMFQNGSGVADNNMRRWCVARPDEYHGDQPRGGFITYSTQGDRDYNCTLIDGDQEDYASFYKNVAGGYGRPATGSESRPLDQETHRCGILNTEMCVMGIMDADSGTSQAATWNDHWGFDTISQSAPQSGNNSDAIIQSSSQDCDVDRASLGHVGNYADATRAFMRGGAQTFTNSILSQIGWNGTATVDMGDMFTSGSSSVFDGVIYDFKGSESATGWSVTVDYSTDPHVLGWEYLPRIEPGSTLDTAGIGAQADFLKGKPYHRKGDADDDTNTSIPAWPHPMEDVFRSHMKAYFKTDITKRLDDLTGTGTVDGDRGFCVDNETFTEYVWGYLGYMLPPLRITHIVSGGVVTFYNAPLESFREDNRTGWRVYKSTDLVNPVADVASLVGLVDVSGLTSGDYIMTNTFSTYTASAWMNGDESGPSIQTLTVTI